MIVYKPIGIIHSPFKNKENMPYQYFATDAEGIIEIFKEYEEGLTGIEEFRKIIILFHFHLQKESVMKIRPRVSNEIKGVFATRAPARPNPIGLSIVELIERNGRFLKIRNVDVVDNTPLLDIKPYVD